MTVLAWSARLLAAVLWASVVEGPAVPPAIPALPPVVVSPPLLPSYITVADPAHVAWVALALEGAQASPTAIRVLADVQEAVAAKGRPVLVDVARVKNAGTYDFDWEVLTTNPRDGKKGTPQAVALLIHELQHFVQNERKLPSDLLELEVEAYTTDMRVARELGARPQRGTFDDRAKRQLRRGPEAFMRWLNKQYPDNIRLSGRRATDYEADLLERHARHQRAIEKLEKRCIALEGVARKMLEIGQPPRLVEQFRLANIRKLEIRLAKRLRDQAWIERDLELFSTPEGRERIRAYVRSVVRKARALSRLLGRG